MGALDGGYEKGLFIVIFIWLFISSIVIGLTYKFAVGGIYIAAGVTIFPFVYAFITIMYNYLYNSISKFIKSDYNFYAFIPDKTKNDMFYKNLEQQIRKLKDDIPNDKSLAESQKQFDIEKNIAIQNIKLYGYEKCKSDSSYGNCHDNNVLTSIISNELRDIAIKQGPMQIRIDLLVQQIIELKKEYYKKYTVSYRPEEIMPNYIDTRL
jgi:hypothetical protein